MNPLLETIALELFGIVAWIVLFSRAHPCHSGDLGVCRISSGELRIRAGAKVCEGGCVLEAAGLLLTSLN